MTRKRRTSKASEPVNDESSSAAEGTVKYEGRPVHRSALAKGVVLLAMRDGKQLSQEQLDAEMTTSALWALHDCVMSNRDPWVPVVAHHQGPRAKRPRASPMTLEPWHRGLNAWLGRLRRSVAARDGVAIRIAHDQVDSWVDEVERRLAATPLAEWVGFFAKELDKSTAAALRQAARRQRMRRLLHAAARGKVYYYCAADVLGWRQYPKLRALLETRRAWWESEGHAAVLAKGAHPVALPGKLRELARTLKLLIQLL